MKFVIDISPEMYKRILGAADSDEPSSVSQFIRIAVENQLALEEASEGPVEAVLEDASHEGLQSGIIAQERVGPWPSLRKADLSWDMLAGVPPSQMGSGPLWGQFNRLLPLKVSIRVLARDLISADEKVSLDAFHTSATATGIRAHRFLEWVDARSKTPRGERLATAFPKNTEKSIRRFQSHFLGYLQRDGVPVGALPTMGFVTISPEHDRGVLLTDLGLGFARLHNPVIDEQGLPTSALGVEERAFLLEHIRTNLPNEFDLDLNLLRWVLKGANTPESLTRQVQRAFPDWSRKVANTMRAGALGRMQELALFSRRRSGRNITYNLEPFGLKLAEVGG